MAAFIGIAEDPLYLTLLNVPAMAPLRPVAWRTAAWAEPLNMTGELVTDRVGVAFAALRVKLALAIALESLLQLFWLQTRTLHVPIGLLTVVERLSVKVPGVLLGTVLDMVRTAVLDGLNHL